MKQTKKVLQDQENDDEISEWDEVDWDESGIDQYEDGQITSAVTAWDTEWVKHYITYLAKVLSLIDGGQDFRLLACTSYPCELFFAHLRYNSKGKNTMQDFEKWVKDSQLAQILEQQLQLDVHPLRLPENSTQTVVGKRVISFDEQMRIRQLADDVFYELFPKLKKNDTSVNYPALRENVFGDVFKLWENEIYSGVEKEYWWPAHEELIVQAASNKNTDVATRAARIELKVEPIVIQETNVPQSKKEE